MNPVLSLVIGAAIAAVSGLVSPFVARLWLKADQRAERARARDAALRSAVEELLSALWTSDVEFSITHARDDEVIEVDEARTMLMKNQALQNAEGRLALLLTKEQQPIHVLMLKLVQAVLNRHDRGAENEDGLTPIRQEALTRFARWLSGDETAEQAQQKFDTYLKTEWYPKFGEVEK